MLFPPGTHSSKTGVADENPKRSNELAIGAECAFRGASGVRLTEADASEEKQVSYASGLLSIAMKFDSAFRFSGMRRFETGYKQVRRTLWSGLSSLRKKVMNQDVLWVAASDAL
jgi:hypothetical protein